MTAGMNSKGRILRFTYPADDAVGGSVPSGTVLYENVYARIAEKRSTQALLEQGLETPSIYEVIFQPGSMDLESNMVYEDNGYPSSPYYGKKFVIIGIHLPSLNQDTRRYIAGSLRRFDIAHREEYQ
jgi:hypothetical protein